MNKHEKSDLYQMQSLPLHSKIEMTKRRLKEWYLHYDGQVFISFSGGKDSTVLVEIATKMGLTDVPLVFVDTGLEYPEIREFVKSYGDRVTWLKPKMNFKQVCKTYGFPFISKEVSEIVYSSRRYFEKHNISVEDVCLSEAPLRVARILGRFNEAISIRRHEPMKYKECESRLNSNRYKFFLESEFEISDKCCNVMKKKPLKKYAKETGRMPITAQMASESRLRMQHWLKNGCNGFEMKSPISNPMSFWTEQDVLMYIKQNNLPIAPVYGDVVYDDDAQINGQMNIRDYLDLEEFELEGPLLKTTGCKRTGCIFCGFGCHMKDDTRFVDLKRTHPKLYEYIMKPEEEGGLGYKEKIDWINKHGNLSIKY